MSAAQISTRHRHQEKKAVHSSRPGQGCGEGVTDMMSKEAIEAATAVQATANAAEKAILSIRGSSRAQRCASTGGPQNAF